MMRMGRHKSWACVLPIPFLMASGQALAEDPPDWIVQYWWQRGEGRGHHWGSIVMESSAILLKSYKRALPIFFLHAEGWGEERDPTNLRFVTSHSCLAKLLFVVTF